MVSLLDLQQRFAEALVGDDGGPLEGLVATRGFSTGERLGIYRHNHVTTLLNTLALAFPVLHALLGDRDFHALAVEYVGAVPSTSGNLNDYGHELAAHLDRHPLLAGREYLRDIARLEWARQEAYLAPEAEPLDLASLAGIPPDSYGTLCFEVHPAARLVHCDWHVTPLLADPDHRDADFRPSLHDEGVLVLRRDQDIDLVSLSPSALRFLASLAAGDCLADALDAAADEDFDLGACLQQHVALGTLVGVRRPQAPAA